MADAFAKIKPTDPFRLTKQAAQRNRNWSDSSGSSLARADASRWARKESKRMKSSYRRPEVSTGREKAIRSGRFKYSCRIFCPVSFFFTPPHYSAELDTQSVFSSGEGKTLKKAKAEGENYVTLKQAARRNRNWSDSSCSSLVRADASRWACKKSKRMKSSYIRTLKYSPLKGGKLCFLFKFFFLLYVSICTQKELWETVYGTTGCGLSKGLHICVGNVKSVYLSEELQHK